MCPIDSQAEVLLMSKVEGTLCPHGLCSGSHAHHISQEGKGWANFLLGICLKSLLPCPPSILHTVVQDINITPLLKIFQGFLF